MSTQVDPRSPERVRAHYEVERELSDRLRRADRGDRLRLYTEVYEELFRRVPDHPQLARKVGERDAAARLGVQTRFLENFLADDEVMLEIGAGDGAVSRALAARCREVFALDVSPTILEMPDRPANVTLVVSDGVAMNVPEGRVTLAYSNQLMEHLHEQDARDQLSEIHRCLAPGGRYLCITPHRASGPHDISTYFDDAPRGFHLKEYSVAELMRLFRAAGFSRTRAYAYVRGRAVPLPRPLVLPLEALVLRLPLGLRRRISRSRLGRPVLNSIQLVGWK